MIKTREESLLALDGNYECEVYAVQSNKLKEGQHDAAPTTSLNWPRDQHKLCNCWFQCAIFICIATRQGKMMSLFQGRTYVGLSEGIGCRSVSLFQWTNAVFSEVIKYSILAGRRSFSWLGPPLHCSIAMFSLLLWSCLCCCVDRSSHVGVTMLLCHCWPCPSHW